MTSKFSGATKVTVLLSSTANDQLSAFNIGLTGVTLTSQSGKQVTLLNAAQNAEFIHLNGALEPVLVADIPQDTYTSAAATVSQGNFSCATLTPSGGVNTSTFASATITPGQVNVQLPAPIAINGAAMGLTLNLLVSQSVSFSSCYITGISPYTITPTFSLTAGSLSSGVAENGLHAQASSIDTASGIVTMLLFDGQTISFGTNSATVFQGINGLSVLTPGMFVDMDAVLQSDGSQLASRIAVQDTDTTNLSVSTGPLLQIASVQPSLFSLAQLHQGYLTNTNQAGILIPYSFGSATFHIGGRITNLQELPFVATFDAASMFAGQNAYFSSHATTLSGGPTYVPASTITLMPQTINGTISATLIDGAFTTYTVALAPYNLIPALAVQPGQTTVLTDPGTVVVYVDSKTQLQNMTPLAVGNIARFTGAIFNDHGTLRMDCLQVNDGVAE
jgi:hypothetical protein